MSTSAQQTYLLCPILRKNPYVAKISDFSAARAIGEPKTIQEHPFFNDMHLHLPIWTAPEVLQQNKWDNTVDLYSYGVILYEIFSRRAYFDNVDFLEDFEKNVKSGNRPSTKGWPPLCQEIVRTCWDNDPKARPEISELISKLNELFKEDSENFEPDDVTLQMTIKSLNFQNKGLTFIESRLRSELLQFRNSDGKLFRSILAKKTTRGWIPIHFCRTPNSRLTFSHDFISKRRL